MKAAFLTGPMRFQVREIPDPQVPDEGLVMNVKACGICGSDLRRWKEGPPAVSGSVIPGHEAAGIVESVGSACSGFKPGDRIAVAPDIHCGTCWYCAREQFNLCDNLKLLGITPGYPGAFAEKLVLTGEVLANGIVHPIPQGLSFEHAAVAEPCSSALACHAALGTCGEETVVIAGGGPMGCIHVALARALGARTIVSEPNAARRDLVRRFGPEAVVDPLAEDLKEKVLGLTGGLGADAVVCANPAADTQRQAVEIVRKGGTVVLFGGLPKLHPMAVFDANRIHYGEIRIVGSFSYHPRFHASALEMIRSAGIHADLLVTHRFPLDRIGEAFAAAFGGDALKVEVLF